MLDGKGNLPSSELPRRPWVLPWQGFREVCMMRSEFYKLYGTPKENGVPVANEANRIIEVVRLGPVYNLMLNSHRQSLVDAPENYVYKMLSIWGDSTSEHLQALTDMDPKEILEQSKVAKELVKQGYDVQMEVRVVPHYLPNGVVHHWVAYAIFRASVEALRCYWDRNSKQKVFIFTKEGVIEIEAPPTPLMDPANPSGFIGVGVDSDTIIISL